MPAGAYAVIRLGGDETFIKKETKTLTERGVRPPSLHQSYTPLTYWWVRPLPPHLLAPAQSIGQTNRMYNLLSSQNRAKLHFLHISVGEERGGGERGVRGREPLF